MSAENVKTLARVLEERGINFPPGLEGRVRAVGHCNKYGGGDVQTGCDGEIVPFGREIGLSCGHVGLHRGPTTCLADGLQIEPEALESILGPSCKPKPWGAGG